MNASSSSIYNRSYEWMNPIFRQQRLHRKARSKRSHAGSTRHTAIRLPRRKNGMRSKTNERTQRHFYCHCHVSYIMYVHLLKDGMHVLPGPLLWYWYWYIGRHAWRLGDMHGIYSNQSPCTLWMYHFIISSPKKMNQNCVRKEVVYMNEHADMDKNNTPNTEADANNIYEIAVNERTYQERASHTQRDGDLSST